MGLFDKKYCDICGKEIKFLGNRKLDDGNMCKDCNAKLSPWFTGRRHTSVAAIKEQLDYRAKNEEQLKFFNPSKIIGKRYKVYIDEGKRLFTVTNSSNWRNANPDLVSFDDIRELKIEIDEDRDEVMNKDAEGNEISFNPPKYEYEYTFNVKLGVVNKFFDDMDFELTADRPEDPVGDSYREYVEMAKDIVKTLTGKDFVEDRSSFTYAGDGATSASATGEEWFCPKCGTKNKDNFCIKCGTPRPAVFEPFFCSKCGEKIVSAETVFCPKCGNQLR
ncbi:MAG: DUF4428 domain-containing protein [Erysipelotrichaceae bacterium]|nr:DUF4428 domain-containing protein [Erysipelotrichaceae bacterium]